MPDRATLTEGKNVHEIVLRVTNTGSIQDLTREEAVTVLARHFEMLQPILGATVEDLP
jgi:hypothetical protein